MPSHSRLTFLAVTLCLGWTAVPGITAEFDHLRVGFDGVGKVGKWLPVTAKASGLEPGRSVELQAAFVDPRGDQCIIVADAGEINSSGEVQLNGCLQIGRLTGSGRLVLADAESGDVLISQIIEHGEEDFEFDSEAAVQSRLRLHRLSTQLVLHFGELAGIPELVRNLESYAEKRDLILNAASVPSAALLPESKEALNAIDALIITDDAEISEAHATAIQHWVRSGGRLIVSSAKNVGEFCETPLGLWIDGLFEIDDQPINIRDMTSVQSFVSGARPLLTNRKAWPLAVINNDQMDVQIDSLSGPIMGSRSFGGGTVTFVGVDLHRRPIDDWKSLPRFYETLLLGARMSQRSADRKSSRISQSGVSDIATQMLSAVDAKPPTGEWSAWSVMGIIVGYLLLIGPIDYLIVSRLLQRPHLTWITFPLMVAIGSIGILGATGSGQTRTLNQLHVVDVCVDDSEQAMIGRSWMSVSSSQTERVDMFAIPSESISAGKAEADTANLIWSGRPEDVYGGMYREGGIGLGRQEYRHQAGDASQLRSVPLLPNGSRGLFSNWSKSIPPNTVVAKLNVSGFGLLKGSFQHSLPFELNDWMLVYGNRVYRQRPGTDSNVLAEGGSCEVSSDLYASDLKAFLNGARKSSDESKRNNSSNRGRTMVAKPYDLRSDDQTYIMTMASFYDAAGGNDYAGLSQALLSQLELSDTIRLNHAVLLGRATTPATSLSVNGEPLDADRSETIVRILLPVDRRPAEARAKTREELDKEKE